ncbi:porin [Quisquiliibacterium transsilvanicum]|uniref:Putative porin n=1 Tax=Quisquiliibacterium transsilvanicum TaxID=1549638 RepID=A0A7W8M9Z6_9BURK|nr:porin [Quisquiliibacterium transsilvanicum]MBB5273418.1 putative porin [Quisquiliibacterium transsilvanicum]
MKKSLLAVAVAAALPAFAYAQTNVVLSGNVKTGITQTKYSNGVANNGNHTAMNDGSSRFIISGSEDLGGGLKAIFQVDNRFRPDDGGTQSLAGGNTFVGLAGGFGTVRLGKLDTYYYFGLDEHGARATALQHSNTSILGYVNGSLGTTTVGTANTATVARNSRLNNVIRWDSPNFGGLSGGLTYSTGASAGAGAGEGAGMGDGNKGQVWSANIGYAAGPLNVGAAYFDEKVEGYKTFAAGSHEGTQAWRVFGGYNFGMFKVGLVYDEAEVSSVGGGDVKRGAWSLPVTAKLGAGTLLFTYSQAMDAKYNGSKDSNSGAKMYVVGYDYPLSKRTSVGVSYAVLNNDSNAAYGYFTGAALNNLTSPTAGQDQKQLHLGVRHAF